MWLHKPLGEVCKIIGGGTPSKSNDDFYGGVIPWATVRDMRNDIISNTEHTITEEAVKRSSTNIIPAKNVVIATRVGLGKVCLIERETAINQDLRGVIPNNKDEIDVNFLFWWLKSISRLIIREGTGATVQGVKLPFVKSLQIPLPPFEEQKRIVSILDKAFAGIDQAIANTEQNIKNAKELFESYLNNIFIQKGEGWQDKKIGELGKVQTGSTPKTSDKENFGDFIPFIKPADFYPNGTLNYKNVGLSEKGIGGSRLINAGSLLMVCIGSIGKCGYSDVDITANQQINALTPAEGISAEFLYYQMIMPNVQKQVIDGSGQATLPIINKTKWSNIVLSIPPLEVQLQSVAVLKELSENCERLQRINEQKLSALNEIKQSLLQQAFAAKLTSEISEVV